MEDYLDMLDESNARPNVIREYPTTPSDIDLLGARPGVDWKGNKYLEICAKRVYDSGIDWQTQHETKINKWVLVPDDTRVSRAFFKVILHDKFHNAYPYGTYESYEFPDAMARHMADDKEWKKAVTSVTVQMYVSVHYPSGSENENDLMENIYLPDPQWNVCEVSTNWRADYNRDCDTRVFARPDSEDSKMYSPFEVGKPLSISGLTGYDMFSDPIVIAFDDECLILRYENQEHVVKVGKPFLSDEKGRDYTTFYLEVCLRNV